MQRIADFDAIKLNVIFANISIQKVEKPLIQYENICIDSLSLCIDSYGNLAGSKGINESRSNIKAENISKEETLL